MKITLRHSLLVLLLTFSSGPYLGAELARADSFSDKCPDIKACIKVVSEILGEKYVYDDDVKGKVYGTANLEINKDNAEWLFTNMLYMNGFSRVPLGTLNTYQIMRIRDAKDSAIPTIDGNAKFPPRLPNNWDYITLRYKLSNPESAEAISRVLRNFMPPNSRIVSTDISGTLMITDASPNLKKSVELIKEMDLKPTPEMKKKWEENAKRWHEEKMHAPKENVKDNSIKN